MTKIGARHLDLAWFPRLSWLAVMACMSAPAPRTASAVTPAPALATTVAPASAPPLEAVPLDQELLSAAERAKAPFLEDLATLVNIDSGTGDQQGLDRVATWLTARLKALGGEVEVAPAPPSAGSVVVGTWHGSGTRELMLMIHYDTVFPAGEAARRPFRSDGTRAFGPGVADAKGGVATILGVVALLRARESAPFKRLTVLFNPDEEKGSFGSRERIAKLAGEHDVVLSFEPPEGDNVVTATNGVGLAELRVKGLAAHAGTPEKGRNAALELAHQVVTLSKLGDAAKGTTVSWTVLHSGERANVIPDAASATADVRYSDPSEIARLNRDVRRLSEQRLVPGTEVTISVESRRPPFVRNAESDRLAALARRVNLGLGKQLGASPVRYGTDAGYAYRPGSTRPMVLEGLGVVGSGLHTPDEWVDLGSIVPRLYLGVRLLEAISRGQ